MIDRGQYFFEMKTFSFLNFIDASKAGQKAVCSVQLQTIYWNGCHAIISDLSLCFIQSSYHHILIGQSWYRHEFLVNHHCKLVNPTNNLDTTIFSTKMKKYKKCLGIVSRFLMDLLIWGCTTPLAYNLVNKCLARRKTYLKYESRFDTFITETKLFIPSTSRLRYSSFTQTFLFPRLFRFLAIAATRTAINSSSSSLLLSVSMFVEKRKLTSFSKLFLQNRYDEQVFCI